AICSLELFRPSLCLWPRQCRLTHVISEVRRSSEKNRESISMRLPLEILFGRRVMPLRPIRGRELRDPFPQLVVDFMPRGFECLCRDRWRHRLVRFREEHLVEFRMKSFSNPE